MEGAIAGVLFGQGAISTYMGEAIAPEKPH